jgi:hypothetical protein
LAELRLVLLFTGAVATGVVAAAVVGATAGTFAGIAFFVWAMLAVSKLPNRAVMMMIFFIFFLLIYVKISNERLLRQS